MKIYNEIIMQWNDKTQQFDIIYENSFNYSGDLILFQNTNSTTTSNGQISTSDDTINTDSEWSDLWEGENIKEYTEAVYDRISQLLIEKFTEIESAIGADGIESIQKTWEDGEIKIGKKDSDILVVYENDVDANKDDMDMVDEIITWLEFTPVANISLEVVAVAGMHKGDQPNPPKLILKAPGKTDFNINDMKGLPDLKDINIKDNVSQFLNLKPLKTDIDREKLSNQINTDFSEISPNTFTHLIDKYQSVKKTVPFYRYRTEDFFDEWNKKNVPIPYRIKKFFEEFEKLKDLIPEGETGEINTLLYLAENSIEDDPIYSKEHVEEITDVIEEQKDKISELEAKLESCDIERVELEKQIASAGGDSWGQGRNKRAADYNSELDPTSPSYDISAADDAAEDAADMKRFSRKKKKLMRRKWMRKRRRWSDIRLKTNIVKVDNKHGINIYEYNYLWGNNKYRGVMAQEILNEYPNAVEKDTSGFYCVDYNQLPVKFERVS